MTNSTLQLDSELIPDHRYIDFPTADETYHKDHDPYIMNMVEHFHRIDFLEGGDEYGLHWAKRTVELQQQRENASIGTEFIDSQKQKETIGPYLMWKLDELKHHFEEIMEERRKWYRHISSSVENKYEYAHELYETAPRNPPTSLSKGGFFAVRPAILTASTGGNNRSISDEFVSVSMADVPARVEQFPIDLPCAVLLVSSPSGSHYPQIPWGGTTVCTCGSKHRYGLTHASPLCKHEIATLLLRSSDELPAEIDYLPPVSRRFTNFEAYTYHDPVEEYNPTR